MFADDAVAFYSCLHLSYIMPEHTQVIIETSTDIWITAVAVK